MYRQIGAVRRMLPTVPIVALTATATPRVREDISESLALRDPLVVVQTFDRANLHYSVRPKSRRAADDLLPLLLPLVGITAARAPPPPRPPPAEGGCGFRSAASLPIAAVAPAPAAPPAAVRRAKASAIVYCQTRKECAFVAEALSAGGARSEAYHAGLPRARREAVERRWASGRTPVMVATIAFGMGIDKPNVRLVAHWGLPQSLEGYHQESG